VKKLIIVLLSFILFVGCTKQGDETTTVPEIKLNGEVVMEILLNSDFTDPGAFVDDGEVYNITVSGTVDTSTVGEYQVVYAFVYEGTTYSVNRTVNVVASSISNYYQINSASLDGTSILVNVLGIDPYSYYRNFELRLYKDNVFYDSITIDNGVNNLDFSGLSRGSSYELRLFCDYLEDSTVIDNEIVIRTFDISLNEIPSVSFSNQNSVLDTIFVDYLVNDSSSVLTSVNAYLYQGDNLVESQLLINNNSDTLTFNGLQYSTEYKIIVELIYLDDSSLEISLEQFVLISTGVASNLSTPSFGSYNCSIENDLYECIFTINNPSDNYFVDVDVHNDDYSIYEQLNSVTPSQSFTFSVSPIEDPISFSFSLMYYDNDLANYVLVSETFDFTPNVYIAPSVSLSNQEVDENVISFDYTVSDPDSHVTSVNAYLYQSDTLIDTLNNLNISSGSVSFTGLAYDTSYQYVLEVVYTDSDSAVLELEENGSLTTETEVITVDVFEITSTQTSKTEYDLDEIGYLLVTLNNPNSYVVDSVYFGSESVSFTVEGNVLKVLLPTSVEQVYNRNLSHIYYLKDSVSTVLHPYTDFSYTVTDLSAPVIPTLVEIIPEYYYFDDTDYDGQTQLNSYVDFVFDNPDDLSITSITLSGYAEAQWITKNASSTNTVVRYDMMFNSTMEDFTVSSFTYVLDSVEHTVSLSTENHNFGHSEYCDSTKIITQVSDIIEMVQTGGYECYVLANDVVIDGNVYDWPTITNNTMISDISLYGNNHSIIGLDFSFDTTVSSLTKVGLFAHLSDSYVYDLNLNQVVVDIPTGSESLYIGALAGQMDDTYVKNISVSGEFTFNHLWEGYVGGLVGIGSKNRIYQTTIDVDFLGSFNTTQNNTMIYMGGLVGYSSDEIYRVNVIGNFNIVDASSNYNSKIGGITGVLRYGSIDHAYFGDGYQKIMQAYYVGGIVGVMEDGSYINHTFTNSTIKNEATLISDAVTGSLVGMNNSGTISNSIALLEVYGKSNRTGLIVGEQGVTGTIINSYHLDNVNTYDDGVVITAYDVSLSGNNVILNTSPLEDSDFYTDLGYFEVIWDLITLDYHMDMPELK